MKNVTSTFLSKMVLVALLSALTPATEAATIGIANYDNDVILGYSGGYVLPQWGVLAGSINNNIGTQVNTMFKFDITSITGPVTSATFTIKPVAVEDVSPQTMALASYNVSMTGATFVGQDLVDANWVAGKRTVLNTFTTTTGDTNPINVDVTAAVQAAKTAGWSYVSFDLFSVTGGSGIGFDATDNWNSRTWFVGNDNNGGPTLTVVPEPASLALLGLGAVALLRRRR